VSGFLDVVYVRNGEGGQTNLSELSESPRKGASFCSASFGAPLATYKYEAS
jgi:hypothetical protein